MPLDQVTKQLKKAYEDLQYELKTISPLRFTRDFRLKRSDTNGWFVTLATWTRRPDVQIWLDKAAGDDVYRFWIGFYSRSKEQMSTLIDGLPAELTPPNVKHPYHVSDWKRVGLAYAFRYPSEKELSRPFLEMYFPDHEFFFGLYDWGGHANRIYGKLDVFRAKMFLTEVVQSIGDDDPDLFGLEGQRKRRFIFYRARERRFRDSKIREFKKLNGGQLFCEVPRCGFNFYKCYGEKGENYAQVHHKRQLARLPKKGIKVSKKDLKDLAVVCANCHVMIHIGGKCRPLDKLIPHKPR